MTQPNPAFFSMDKESVLKHLETQVSGLSEQEASDRLHRFGPNSIESEKKISLLRRIINQLKNVMVLILTAAAAIALLVGDIKSTLIVIAVVVMNTVLGVVQESKAEKAIEALRNLASPDAIVRRDGLERIVKAKELVIGDIVLIESGNHIPADIRLIEAVNLKIEEASLTGESVPTEKQTNLIQDVEVSLGDKFNMAFTGTSVVYGRGVVVVIATAMDTEIGKIAKYLSQNNKIEATPLQKRLAEMSKYISDRKSVV